MLSRKHFRDNIYFNNTKTKTTMLRKKKQSIISIALFILTIIFLTQCVSAPKISVTDEEIRISGRYGERIRADDVKEIKLLNQMPRIQIRTNGISFGEIQRGYFRLENIGRAKLFLHSRSAPFILIERKNGVKIFLNYQEREKTENYYQKLREWFDNRN